MNRENIQKVRDVIAALPRKRFNMTGWAHGGNRYYSEISPSEITHDCDTAACIGGWAVALSAPDETTPFSTDVRERASAFLGIDGSMSMDLFMPNIENWSRITNAHAVRVLDHLLATGEVDWKSTRRVKKAVS